MYTNISDEFKEIVKSNSIIAVAKIVFTTPNITILPNATDTIKSSLIDVTIIDNCYDNGKLIGTTMSKEVEIQIKNKDNLDLADKEFSLYVGVKLSNGEYEYIPYGNYIVTDYEDTKSNNIFKIVAYDYMTKLNSKFSDYTSFSPTFPITLKAFKTQFVTGLGLEIEDQILPNDSFIINEMPGFESNTNRTVLGYIAELQGCFAKINRDNKVEFILKKYPTKKISNTSISISDGNENYLSNIGISGNTIQNGTPTPSAPIAVQSCGDSINLLENKLTTQTLNGITFTKNSDGSVTLNGTSTKAAFVYVNTDKIRIYNKPLYLSNGLSSSIKGLLLSCYVYDDNNNYLRNLNENNYTTISSGYFSSFNIYILANVTLNNVTIYPSLHLGTTRIAYTPYGVGNITEKISNKNLFNIDGNVNEDVGKDLMIGTNTVQNGILTTTANMSASRGVGQKINCKVGDTITFSATLVSFGTGTAATINLVQFKNEIYFSQHLVTGAKLQVRIKTTLTIPEGVTDVYATFITQSGTGAQFKDIQVELNSTATDYIAHEEQDFIIPTQQPMRKIGTVQDSFTYENGKWQEKHWIGKIILNGTEGLAKNTTYTTTSMLVIQYYTPNAQAGTANIISDRFKYANPVTINSVRIAANYVLFGLDITQFSDVDVFKTWIVDNNITLYYQLATPTYLDCTTEQIAVLEQMQKVQLYNGINNIYSTDTILPFITLNYANIDEMQINSEEMNSKLVIDNKYGEINVVSLTLSNVTGENVTLKDENSIILNGETDLEIPDNPFVYTQALRENAIQEIYTALDGFKYVPTKFNWKSSLYNDCGDCIEVYDIDNKKYISSIILNQTIKIPATRQSAMENEALTKTQVKNQYISKTEQKNSHTEFEVDKANKKITAIVSEIGDRSQKTTTVTEDINGLQSDVSSLQDITNEISGNKTITLTNCLKGQVFEMHIYGNNTAFSSTIFGNAVFGNAILGWNSRIKVTDNNNTIIYDLGIKDTLRQNGTTYDEYVLNEGKASIIRRINSDGTIKATAITEDLGVLDIELSEGTNILEILDYTANLKAKYIIKNDYTTKYATNVIMNSKFTQTSESIKTEVSKKVGKSELATYIEQNSEAVKVAWNTITDFIQLMVINGNASIATLNESKKILMALDKLGQHFYKSDGTTILGNIGISVDADDNNKQYLSFATSMDYGENLDTGMAWGIRTSSDNKFHPIMYLKNYDMPSAGEPYGQMVMSACDLVLEGSFDEGSGGAIVCGDLTIGNSITGMVFEDSQNNVLFKITKGDGSVLKPYDEINILDKISFFRNTSGTNSLGVGYTEDSNGNKTYKAIITDNGDIAATKISADTFQCFGHIYCNNGVEPFSLAEMKKDIKKYDHSALEEVLKTDIYNYNYKDDKEGTKKRTGAIIGDDYNISKEIIGTEGKGIDTYSMLSIAYKAIQEQQEEIEELKKEIEILKGGKNNE